MLCRDGLTILIGHTPGIAAWACLTVWIYFGAYLMPKFRVLREMVRHWF